MKVTLHLAMSRLLPQSILSLFHDSMLNVIGGIFTYKELMSGCYKLILVKESFNRDLIFKLKEGKVKFKAKVKGMKNLASLTTSFTASCVC